jgi:uncharacterized protein YggE
MRTSAIAVVMALLVCPRLGYGQVGGNVGYGQAAGKAKAEQTERSKRVVAKDDQPPTGTSTFVEAIVMINVKADEHVAVFGLAQEGASVAECSQKMDAMVKEFAEGLTPLGGTAAAPTVDFAAQNKIYGYEITGDIAREKLVGFELKKNVAVRFRDLAQFDRIVAAAARAKVYDLIKVDYVVNDIQAVQDRLMEEAARVVKQKSARYEKLLGIKLLPPAQVYAERHAAHYPTQMYDSYTAFETENVSNPFAREKYTVQSARKSRTFFFNALDASGFDHVVNPVVTEPVVQFTLYLKVKYEVEQARAR